MVMVMMMVMKMVVAATMERCMCLDKTSSGYTPDCTQWREIRIDPFHSVLVCFSQIPPFLFLHSFYSN